MTSRVVDLRRIRAALHALDAYAHGHPEITAGDMPERLAASIAAEEPDDIADTDERLSGSERRRERPASRDD